MDSLVTELRFFESGDILLPTADRVYRRTLAQSTTRSVAWELNLAHPPPANEKQFTLKAVYYRPDGSVLNRLTHNASIPAGSILSSGALAWGWTLPGSADENRPEHGCHSRGLSLDPIRPNRR